MQYRDNSQGTAKEHRSTYKSDRHEQQNWTHSQHSQTHATLLGIQQTEGPTPYSEVHTLLDIHRTTETHNTETHITLLGTQKLYLGTYTQHALLYIQTGIHTTRDTHIPAKHTDNTPRCVYAHVYTHAHNSGMGISRASPTLGRIEGTES